MTNPCWEATALLEDNSPVFLIPTRAPTTIIVNPLARGLKSSPKTAYILLMFGSGFFTDVPGEALGTLAGPPRPWVLGEPEGPLAGDS